MTDDVDAHWFSEDEATFGDRLAGAREAVGMTQTSLARRMGIKLQTLRNWEEDLSEPRANKLQMAAGVLNVSLKWMLTGEGEGVDAPSEETLESADFRDILLEMRDIRAQMMASSDRLARLEKKLRRQVSGGV